MSSVVLDACEIINLYASGRFLSILASLRHEWYLPIAVECESQHYRQPDPADPKKLIALPIDLDPALYNGALRRCDCEGEEEIALYVEIAASLGDDGESMGLAIAYCRGWTVLTDDKKAIRIARELGVTTLSTPEVMKRWDIATAPGVDELSRSLRAIERFANYRPGPAHIDYDWWMSSIEV